MLSKERVLEALRIHLDDSADCEDCPYHDNDSGCNSIDMFAEVLELLKAQEPTPCGEKIKAGDVMLDFYECGHCKNAIRKPWRYCPFCGRELKWDDA